MCWASTSLRPSGIKWILQLTVLLLGTVDSFSPNVLQVDTQFGLVAGKLTESARGRHVVNFLGLPYAEPPTEHRRFKSPIPWNRTFNGTYYAVSDKMMCPQRDSKGNIIGNEDCLYLNVFVPLVPDKFEGKKKLPVMVFVHGGAFNTGNSDSNKFSPEYLLDQNIVLVTLNYRLNVLGFFSTTNKASPGNYGLKDIVVALQWVQENIEVFNGDKNSVTLFGHSAGASAVHLLALNNRTEGLFQRYILQSGSALASWSLHPRRSIRKISLDLARLLRCRRDLRRETNTTETATESADDIEGTTRTADEDDTGFDNTNELEDDEKMMECMRLVPANDILRLHDYFHVWRQNPWCVFGPTIEDMSEDAIVTVHPITAIKNHWHRDLPMIAGVVEDEGLIKTIGLLTDSKAEAEMTEHFSLYLPFLMEYQERVANFTAFASAVENFYFAGNVTDRLNENITQAVGDAIINWPMYRTVKYHAESSNSNVYFYRFSYNGTFSSTFSSGNTSHYGIAHSDELNYLFPIFNYMFSDELLHNTEDDTTMINVMTEMWANFASKGEPRAWMTTEWPNYKENGEIFQIGLGKFPDMYLADEFLLDRMAFWENMTLNLNEDLPEVNVLLLASPSSSEEPKSDSTATFYDCNFSLIFSLVILLCIS